MYTAFGAGVMPRYIHNAVLPTVKSFKPNPELEAGLSITALFGVVLMGPVGTGKTWGLMALACDALAIGLTVKVVNWERLKLEVRDTYKASAKETELDILDRYCDPDVLCLDDLGAGAEREGRESEAARVLLYNLLDRRYNTCRATHISTNLPTDQLVKRYDERTARRVNEMCKEVVLTERIA